MDWVAVPSSGMHLPDPGIEPTSPALQADSLSLSHHLPSNYEDSRGKTYFYEQCLTQYSGMLLIFIILFSISCMRLIQRTQRNDSKEWAPLTLICEGTAWKDWGISRSTGEPLGCPR